MSLFESLGLDFFEVLFKGFFWQKMIVQNNNDECISVETFDDFITIDIIIIAMKDIN